MRILAENTLCVIIDMQERLIPAMHNKEILIKNVETLIQGMKTLDIPMIVTQQYTKGIGPTYSTVSQALGYDNPDELPYIEKMTFSSAGEPSFLEEIKKSGKKNIVICGVEGHVCVMQTSIDLLKEGYNVIPVVDCISTRDPKSLEIALKRYEKEGATLATLESILFELTVSATNPAFKAISKLIK